MITQQLVKDLFDYDPESGVCTWKVKRSKSDPGEPIDARYAYKNGYITIGVKGRSYILHRLIWVWMTGEMPDHQVGHKNGNKLDNRWSNLGSRKGTQYILRTIRRKYTRSNAAVDGVHESATLSSPSATSATSTPVWVAQITVDGKLNILGTFDSEDKARDVYLQAKVLFHGQTESLDA